MDKTTFNVLLFGYSELVIKALCGFRDHLMEDFIFNINGDARGDVIKNLNNPDYLKTFSDRIKIFICEGQPKTQTGIRDRLLYHDGIQYALALKKMNFNNLILIPDITFYNIIKKTYPGKFFSLIFS